jgi:ABC-type phosphate transport system permease subunit
MKAEVTLRDIYQAIEDFRKEVREQYVTKDEFMPVKNIAFGLVSLITFTVIGAILTMVIKTVVAK